LRTIRLRRLIVVHTHDAIDFKDVVDATALIETLGLSSDFADQLNPDVSDKCLGL
jgi:hypothetical protein